MGREVSRAHSVTIVPDNTGNVIDWRINPPQRNMMVPVRSPGADVIQQNRAAINPALPSTGLALSRLQGFIYLLNEVRLELIDPS